MINFPIFQKLDITGYGLYPGLEDAPGLHPVFHPGLTLVLGTNGLGKTTLISILFRLLTGPYDISGLAENSEVGSTRLSPSKLSSPTRRMFAERVLDGAVNGRARLTMRLGEQTLVIERRLSDLALTFFTINGASLSTHEENSFQKEIPRLAGVWSFGDWILLLRQLVFYFEDRRALVWDPSAQRQILRMLFLPTAVAEKWTFDEREILELDSRMRNLNAAVTKEERALSRTEFQVADGVDVRQELRSLQELQAIDLTQRDLLEASSLQLEGARLNARLRALKAEQEREARYRALERAKLLKIGTRFPKRSQTARFILTQLLSEEDCLVCGTHVPVTAVEYENRIDHDQCVICGTDLSGFVENSEETQLADAAVADALNNLKGIDQNLMTARAELKRTAEEYDAHIVQLSELNTTVNDRSIQIGQLLLRLPPEEAEVHKQRTELAAMHSRVLELKKQLVSKRKAFGEFVQARMRELISQSDEVKRWFDRYAEGFLLEKCQLVWAPKKAQIGQGGDAVEFPAFELDMTGVDFPSPVRRSGPEQVSESQREFIDLAFRMALMAVAGHRGNGSLVIDAPESSLDGVFAVRAAEVLSRFAAPDTENRLVVTSNMVEGELIPSLLARTPGPDSNDHRVVDLMSLAAPTAAVREKRREYEIIRDRILGRGPKESR